MHTVHSLATQSRLCRFETPFTKSGSARGSIADQWVRKTLLSVEYEYPYIKPRQAVTAVNTIECSPIEVAIETIAARAESLDAMTRARPVNLKLLQLQLQASMHIQVVGAVLTRRRGR